MEVQLNKKQNDKMEQVINQKIIPFLWFDNKAEQAATFYTNIFNDSKINSISYYNAESASDSGVPEGTAMTVDFILEGQHFAALNGGPVFEITPAISLFINCDDEHEINTLWEKLSEGGTTLMELNKYPFSDKFGWLKDQFGVTWQLMIGNSMQKIIPFLMFTGKYYGMAEEAMNFYISLFEQSGIIHIEHSESSDINKTVKHALFSLNEQEFMAIDSKGHDFTFTPAFSLVVNCETQEEIDHFWNKLTEGADENAQQCGWLQDRFGVSWQIVPTALGKLISDADPVKSQRVMRAMLPMKKLNIKTLIQAYEQNEGLGFY